MTKIILTASILALVATRAIAQQPSGEKLPPVLMWAKDDHFALIAVAPERFGCTLQQRPGRPAVEAVAADPEIGLRARRGRPEVAPKEGFRCFLPVYAPALRAALHTAGK